MKEQIEKLEHGLMICEATGTELVHIEKTDAEKILAVLSEQQEIARCKDCKHRLECDYWILNGDDWYCADVERDING